MLSEGLVGLFLILFTPFQENSERGKTTEDEIAIFNSKSPPNWKRIKLVALLTGNQLLSVLLFVPWLTFKLKVAGTLSQTSFLSNPEWWNLKLCVLELFDQPVIMGISMVLIFVAGILGIFQWFKSQTTEPFFKLISLLILAIIPVIASYGFSLWIVPVFNTKYIIVASLGIFLSVGYSISLIPVRNWIKVGIAIFFFGFCAAHLDLSPPKIENWKSTAEKVKTLQKTENSAVFLPVWFQLPSFVYYYNREFFSNPASFYTLTKNEHIFWGELISDL